MRAHGYRFDRFGGNEVLDWTEIDLPEPGENEALVRHTHAGVNFIDIYIRRGQHEVPLPAGLGTEGAGVVEAVGPGVTHVKPGDRIAYAPVSGGSFATHRVMPAWRLVKLPAGVSNALAAACLLKGMTTQYLLNQITPLKPGDQVLFHAAAGGVGLIAGQWARALGLEMIGTAGSPEKVERALAAGYAHCIDYRRENFVERVRELTGGRGVKVVFDSVGKDTLEGSLDCLVPRGMLVCFGAASGPRPPLDIETLSKKGSLYLTRPTLNTYAGTPEGLAECSSDLLRRLETGVITVDIQKTFGLTELPAALDFMEGRQTTGSVVIDCSR